MINMQEDILNEVEVVKDEDQLTVKVPLWLTEAKLEVLCEVAKSYGIELPELILDAVDQDIRALLEGSSDVGEALNKQMCDTWLKEISETSEDNIGTSTSNTSQVRLI
jgi:hypothetical protein